MTQMVDLDRTIVAWLRDGEMVAPTRLAAEIQLAVRAAPVRRESLLHLPWTVGGPRRPRTLALVLAGAAAATMLLGMLWASGSVPPPNPPNPSPSSVPSPSPAPSSTAQPSPTSSIPSVAATANPVQTYPPATTLSLPGVALDLPAGWFRLGDHALGIIAALDSIGDPYAGVFNMILHPLSLDDGPFLYHSAEFEPQADAGMRFLTSGIQESTAPLEADRVRAVLEGAGYVVARSTVKLATGRAIVLDWDVAYNGPDLHYQAYFLKVGGAVRRIDFATPRPPSEALARQLLDIVRSVRPG